MQQFETAGTVLHGSALIDTGLLALVTTLFFLVVLTYFLISALFQSKRRRGRYASDGMAFVLSGGLFMAFTVSYLEIFLIALRLPFAAWLDLAIGLILVTAAGLGAHALAKALNRRSWTKQALVAG